MASSAGTLISSIRRRVRDDNATAHTQTFVRDLLDRAQVAVNAASRNIITDTTLSTVAGQAIYHVETDLANAISPERVLWNNQVIDRIEDWRELARMDKMWLVRRDNEIKAWAMIGNNLLILYPALRVADSVVVRSNKVTNALSVDATLLEIPEELETIAMGLTTVLLLLKQRDLDRVEEITQEVSEKMSFYRPVDWVSGKRSSSRGPQARESEM